MRVKYVGGLAAVEIADTGAVVERNGEVDVPDHVGKGLLEQADWKPAPAKKSKED